MIVMKFINKKQENFFIFFYRKPQHMCIYFITNLQKKHEHRGGPSRVLNPGIFTEDMALPAASFLSSLYAWFRLHIG